MLRIARRVTVGLMLAGLVSASTAETVQFKDTGFIASGTRPSGTPYGPQSWGGLDISGLRYERITTIDTSVPGSTYEDAAVAFDPCCEIVRTLVGGTVLTTPHGNSRDPSPSFVSYTLNVFLTDGSTLFSFSGTGPERSQVGLRHLPGGATGNSLVVQASSRAMLGSDPLAISVSQLALDGVVFTLPGDGRFIDSGIYALDPAIVAGGGNAVFASHYINPSTQVIDLTATLLAQTVTVNASLSAVPENSTQTMLVGGVCVAGIVAARRRSRRERMSI